MRPQLVNPKNFQVEQVIYETEDFSIAYGIWKTGNRHLGMRWNGNNEEDTGYPKLFNNPVWFLIPEELAIPFTKSLLEVNHDNKQQVLAVLSRQLMESEL